MRQQKGGKPRPTKGDRLDVSNRYPRPFPPSFASAWGDDRYGLWADLEVPSGGDSGIVTQRLRWIPPGRFLMFAGDGSGARR